MIKTEKIICKTCGRLIKKGMGNCGLMGNGEPSDLHTTTPIQETTGELKINGKVMITHGMITHEPSEKCSICDEVRETFQKDLRSGKVEKLVGKIDPKIKKELLTTPIQETGLSK